MRRQANINKWGWYEPDPRHDEYEGRPRRTKHSHRYSYDPIVLWDSGNQATSSVYDDRLFQWDYDKTVRLKEKHLPGQRWANADPKQIEAFLQEWQEIPTLRLVAIIEYCNQATGFPCWRFDFTTEPLAERKGELNL